MRKSSEPALPAKFDVNPPEGSQFGSIVNTGGSAISPDGRTLAFVATTAKGETLLYVRPLESLEARALPGTAGGGAAILVAGQQVAGICGRRKVEAD